MNFFTALLAQMPDAVAKGLIWGLMALGCTSPIKSWTFRT